MSQTIAVRAATRPVAGWIDKIGVVLVAGITTGVYLWAYRQHPAHPHIGGSLGWWNWFDQSWYFGSAKAWAAGDLNPERHLYLPGYPLLGAPLIALLSVHAYLVVNLLCLLASLWLFSRLAIRLAPPGVPHAGLLGAVIFALASIGSPALLEVWVVPWSSTASTPLTYAALLAGARAIEQPGLVWRWFWVGLAGGAIAAFRPSDSAPILVACAVGMAITVLRPPWHWRALGVGLGLGALGLAVALALLALAYLPLYGPRLSHYVQVTNAIGLEWRLLPLRWVTLGLDPRPLFESGRGLVAAFPWIPVGLAGAAVSLIVPRAARRWAIHLMVICACVLQIAIYLTFRDLYPEGLFLYENYHYYKFVVPLLLLYTLLLGWHLVAARPRKRVAALAISVPVLAALLPWRAEFLEINPIPRQAVDDPAHAVGFASGLGSVSDAVLVAASGSWEAVYGGASTLTIAGRSLTERVDYKLHPMSGGFFLVPLRPLPSGPALLTVDPRVTLDPSVPLLHARQAIRFGVPCWLPITLPACGPHYILPTPALPAEGVTFAGGQGQNFLAGGWSVAEPTGRWTDGNAAVIRMRAPAAVGDLLLEIQLSAYVPTGSPPLRMAVLANGRAVAEAAFADGQAVTVSASIPAAFVSAAPDLEITLDIANPRSPKEANPPSTDARRLGVFVRQIRLVATPGVKLGG